MFVIFSVAPVYRFVPQVEIAPVPAPVPIPAPTVVHTVIPSVSYTPQVAPIIPHNTYGLPPPIVAPFNPANTYGVPN